MLAAASEKNETFYRTMATKQDKEKSITVKKWEKYQLPVSHFVIFIAQYLVIALKVNHMQYGCKKPLGDVKRQKLTLSQLNFTLSAFWISKTFHKAADWIFKPFLIPMFRYT